MSDGSCVAPAAGSGNPAIASSAPVALVDRVIARIAWARRNRRMRLADVALVFDSCPDSRDAIYFVNSEVYARYAEHQWPPHWPQRTLIIPDLLLGAAGMRTETFD
jgi:hypothetical protein